jgi:hypothetical protein
MFSVQTRRPIRSIRSKNPTAIVLALALALSGELLAESTPEPVSPLRFELEDQFGELHTSDQVDSQYLILIGGDRRASEESRQWAATAHGFLTDSALNLASVQVVRVADLRGIPAAMKGLVSKKMRGRYSTPVLMDWHGDLAGRFGFQPNVANIALIEISGEIVMQMQPELPEEQQIANLKQALAELKPVSPSQAGAATQSGTMGPGL